MHFAEYVKLAKAIKTDTRLIENECQICVRQHSIKPSQNYTVIKTDKCSHNVLTKGYEVADTNVNTVTHSS